jgi:hypothetical protein
VETSFASFATIADVVPPAKTRKTLPPFQKNSQADLYLTSLNDGVFRPNERYDSEA